MTYWFVQEWPIVNDDWMNSPDISQDSTTAQPQIPSELPNVSSGPPLRCSTRPSIPPKWYGQDCSA